MERLVRTLIEFLPKIKNNNNNNNNSNDVLSTILFEKEKNRCRSKIM